MLAPLFLGGTLTTTPAVSAVERRRGTVGLVLPGRRRRRSRHFRSVTVVAVAVAAVLLAAGCSSSPASSKGAASPSAADASAALNWGLDWSAGYTQLDPIDDSVKQSTPPAENWMSLIYDTMIHQTAHGFQPGLATSWTSPKSNEVVLTLRQGVKFQDGTPFNAAAVKYAWDRVLAIPAATGRAEHLESVTVLGPYEVEAVFPTGSDAWAFEQRELTQAFSDMGVPSEAALKKDGCTDNGQACPGLQADPVGAGPYSFVSSTSGQDVKLTKFAGYWDASAYKFAGINFVQTAAGTATTIAIRSGTIDGAYIPDASDAAPFKGQSGYTVTSLPGLGIVWLGMCTTQGPLTSLAARQAVSMSIDRPAINQSVFGGRATPLYFAVPPGVPVSQDTGPAYNPAQAKTTLAASGQAGKSILILATANLPNAAAIATILQSELSAAGFKATVDVSDNMLADQTRLKPALALANGTVDTNIGDVYPPTGLANPCGNSFPDVTSALTTATDLSLSPSQQNAGWASLQAAVLNNAVQLTLLGTPNVVVTSSEIHGLTWIEADGAVQTPVFAGVYKT
jgi:peptide/nickel transport system substrate-binding protein